MRFRQVITLKSALLDLDEAKAFYDANDIGIGFYFIDSILSEIESLHLYAGIHPRQYGFYRMLSRRFPFGIYYDIKEETVRVAAILDMRRNPKWINKKLHSIVD